MKPKVFAVVVGALFVVAGVVIGFAVRYSAEYEGPFATETADCGSAWSQPTQFLPRATAACAGAVNAWLPWPFIAVGVLIIAGALLVKWDRTAVS